MAASRSSESAVILSHLRSTGNSRTRMMATNTNDVVTRRKRPRRKNMRNRDKGVAAMDHVHDLEPPEHQAHCGTCVEHPSTGSTKGLRGRRCRRCTCGRESDVWRGRGGETARTRASESGDACSGGSSGRAASQACYARKRTTGVAGESGRHRRLLRALAARGSRRQRLLTRDHPDGMH